MTTTPPPAESNGWLRRVGYSQHAGILAFGLGLVSLGLVLQREDWLSQGAVALALSIAATGLGLALGLGGEYLLGISFVVAVGAYPTAVLTEVYAWGYWPAAVVGTLAGAIVGLVLSLPGLRVSQFYFGMVGFFLVFLVPNVVEMLSKWTNGSRGLPVYIKPTLFGVELEARGMFVLAAVALTISLLVVHNIRLSPFAVDMRRMRDAPYVLASTGTPVWKTRFTTYLLASALGGLSGAIYSHINIFLQPELFTFNMTILILAAVIVGGSRTLVGPSIGLVILYLGPRLVLRIDGFADIMYGTVVLVSVLLFRGGVVQAFRDLSTRLSTRLKARTSRGVAPGPLHDVGPADPERLVQLLTAFRGSLEEPRELAAIGVTKRFGQVRGLDFQPDEEFRVRTSHVVLLLGPNGSGKTTLINGLSGQLRPDRGTITLDGTNIGGLPTHRVARAGIARSFQTPVLPEDVTPRELLTARVTSFDRPPLMHWAVRDRRARRAAQSASGTAGDIITAAGLGRIADQPCSALTSGQRRLVDVLGALISDARFVLLDEPAAGLGDEERQLLADVVRGLANCGIGFVVVEHDLQLALSLADEVVVMAMGRPFESGTPAEVRASDGVRSILIGSAS